MGEGAILMLIVIVAAIIVGAWVLVKAARRVGQPLDHKEGERKY